VTNDNAGTIKIGQVIYIKVASTAGHMDLAKSNAASTATPVALVYDATIATSAAGNVQTSGVFTATTTQWDTANGSSGGLTPGAAYYLSPTTAGAMTTTAPTTAGQYVIRMGTAQSTTVFFMEINPPILL
jgi:hypothetical protein